MAALVALGTPFIPTDGAISLSQRGNLGEFISFHIARNSELKDSNVQSFAHNAIQPLTNISGAGLDLTYVYFDPTDEKNDLLYIQEIKTTGADNLNYLGALQGDYQKLFSTDLNLTLHSRIQGLSNSLELERNREDYAVRVQRLGAKTAQECNRVRLLPTGVHRLGVGNPVQKMLAVRSAIAVFGWNISSITPWAVGLSDLEDRLLRLARGLP